MMRSPKGSRGRKPRSLSTRCRRRLHAGLRGAAILQSCRAVLSCILPPGPSARQTLARGWSEAQTRLVTKTRKPSFANTTHTETHRFVLAYAALTECSHESMSAYEVKYEVRLAGDDRRGAFEAGIKPFRRFPPIVQLNHDIQIAKEDA